jgi:hypothetical protein
MASRKDWVRPANMGPVMTIDPSCLGFVLSNMYFVRASNPALNSGRIFSICNNKKINQTHLNMLRTYLHALLDLVTAKK